MKSYLLQKIHFSYRKRKSGLQEYPENPEKFVYAVSIIPVIACERGKPFPSASLTDEQNIYFKTI